MNKFSFLFLIFCSTLWAQDIDFGIKAGLNRSSVIGDFREGYEGTLSFHAGVFLEVPIRGKFSFHPEILYSSQGFKVDIQEFNIISPGETIFEDGGNGYTARNFLVIPLVTRYNLAERISLELGPQLGFLMNSVSKINDEKYSFSGDFAFDIGPTLGFGYEIGNKLKLQVRYFIGLSDLLRKSPFEERGYSDNQFDSVFQLSAGYVIF